MDNDIAGVVVLQENASNDAMPGYIENLVHIATSYSCVSLDGKSMKITAPLVDPEKPGADKRKIADTINMLANMRFWTQQIFSALMSAEAAVRQRFNVKPPPKPSSPIIPLNGNFKKPNR